ncbi:PREDICTED: PHD finger protein EHD3-like isoform X1 [Lupinus angustifolius]|uniref:PHD finger protein EHD3-like isoform X1 n=1 Tax=Lupinus angustifolius TaxID=3871 RepID=UPI00092E5624|nr:PREDICTED: PHD finger protein EHD3-like isoform X1 [Lupinus angustifolius]XP_019462089.1 PREDICTED: PHD finger protein EHD3-like isoform X1 [Lupinus angustifolius]
MDTEDENSNTDNPMESVNNGVAIEDGNGAQCFKYKAANSGVAIENGNGVRCLKNETVNNRVAIADGNGVAEWNTVRCLKNEIINNGVAVSGRNGGAEGREVQCLKIETVNNGMAIGDGNGFAEGKEVQCLNNETVNSGVVIADRNSVSKGKDVWCLKNQTVNNGMDIASGKVVAEGDSGGVVYLRTYKRRKDVKSSSESKVQVGSKGCVEAASHLLDQAVKKPCDVAVGNPSKNYSHGHWRNVVLNDLYHSLGGSNGGIEGCIREALMNYPKTSCAPTVTENFKIVKGGQECSSQSELLSHRLQNETNGHANIMHNGCSSRSDGRGGTERCQRVFCNILTSEKFGSLCKVLLENFQGIKPERVFDFSVINTRMKEHAYEHSPTLFLSDIEQVWRKLQDTGNEIVAITKSLSVMSKASYCEKVGVSANCSFEDEKQVLYNWESRSQTKAEQKEDCAAYKSCICRYCGKKADGADCLVCGSCEEVYHVPCIEPSVKEIPHKSWFCANCSGKGIGSPHEKCVVCERLNVPKTLNNIFSEENIPTNEETLNVVEENSNCTHDDGIQVSIGGENSPECKICEEGVDGEKIKICAHPFCPSKYYHVRCLSSKQMKLYAQCWYCPSCLCRVCLTDQDDDNIVLCDGCDHAYHTYCMKPPRTSIPKGKWFCRKCDAGIQAIRRAKKAYESKKCRTDGNVSKLNDVEDDKRWSNKRGRELNKVGGMDLLLTAANTLNVEENLSETQIESRRT